jgi:hypothetical protein
MNPIEIKLPFEHGKYLLNEMAVIAIQHASYLELNFKSINGVPVEGECWLRVGTTVVNAPVDPADEVFYQMPINISNLDLEKFNWQVSHKEICDRRIKNALQLLVQPGAYLEFLPDFDHGHPDLTAMGFGMDTIYWTLYLPGQPVQEIFAREVRHAYDRLIRKGMRD